MKKHIIKFLINFIPNSNKRKELRVKILGVKKQEFGFNKNLLDNHSYSGAKFISPNTKVGKYCSIGTGCIIGADFHPTNWVTTSPKLFGEERYLNGTFKRFANIEIGNDVWIGANAIIVGSRDIKIGNGAIIAAGAVVTRDVPAYAIVGGSPARVIKYRFSEDIIEKLEQSKWWDYNIEFLKTLPLENPEQFVKALTSEFLKTPANTDCQYGGSCSLFLLAV